MEERKVIRRVKKTTGRHILQKTKENKENYVITGEDLRKLAMEQEENRILEAIDKLSVVFKGEKEVREK